MGESMHFLYALMLFIAGVVLTISAMPLVLRTIVGIILIITALHAVLQLS